MIFRFGFLAFVTVFLLNTNFNKVRAQEVKKNAVRIAADYVKVMDGESYINIKATSRVDKQNVVVPDIELIISNEIGDEEQELGKVKTNMQGISKFVLKSLSDIKPDTSNTYTIAVAFNGNDLYKRASKSVSFKDASITAKIVVEDSINYVSATLMDAVTGNPIQDQSLTVQVERLFRPLMIGEEFNNTDEEGSIMVPVENDIPGIDGILTLEVVLKENEDYGTVKAALDAPIGVTFVHESTFDQRTMWSPRKKTPLFLLIVPNLITFGMWGFILYFIMKLFKISKS